MVEGGCGPTHRRPLTQGTPPLNVEQFRNAHRLRPFKPFVIHTASGESYPVTHPETLWQSPGGHTVIVGIKGEEVAMIDIDHITEFVFATRKAARRPR
jgi:hypothetical protein